MFIYYLVLVILDHLRIWLIRKLVGRTPILMNFKVIAPAGVTKPIIVLNKRGLISVSSITISSDFHSYGILLNSPGTIEVNGGVFSSIEKTYEDAWKNAKGLIESV